MVKVFIIDERERQRHSDTEKERDIETERMSSRGIWKSLQQKESNRLDTVSRLDVVMARESGAQERKTARDGEQSIVGEWIARDQVRK